MTNSPKKVPCKNPNCNKSILEITANKTGGYCYPCYNNIKAKEREEYIKNNIKYINLYEGINDPVEIIKIMNKEKKYDPLIKYIDYPKSEGELYELLSDSQVEELKLYAINLYDYDEDTCINILLHLVCLRKVNIDDFLIHCIENENYLESSLFCGASDDVSNCLLNKLNTLDDSNTNLSHILYSLAMIGNDRIVRIFSNWKENGSPFDDKLYTKAYEYSYEGGWEIDNEGKRRNLYYNNSHSITDKSCTDNIAVNFLNKETNKCPCCGKPLFSLFRLNTTNLAMLNLKKYKPNKLNISTCIYCTCYDPIYTDIDLNGNTSWSKINTISDPLYIPECEEDEDYNNNYYVDTNPKCSTYASNQFLKMKLTKIGGMPAWIQDADYPTCPKCNNTMKFIGQISMEDFEEYGEGIYYGFLCEDCNIASTTYQQT